MCLHILPAPYPGYLPGAPLFFLPRRKLLTEALPLLLDLDRQSVAERWTSDEEDAALSDEDEEFPELRGPFCSERGDPCFPKCAAALWGPGEARRAVVSGEVVPGPEQSFPTLSPPL